LPPQLDDLQAIVAEHVAGRDRVVVLEAGCGSLSRLDMGPVAHVVGIDISQKQLDRNPDLAEKILGDITTYELPTDAFDLIACWDVLEHLDRPERAVARFFTAVRPGGLIVLKLPNLMSLKGQITKWTPHWFHVWVYRYVYRQKDAGREDTAPFRTFLRRSVAPAALRRQAEQAGLVIRYEGFYESNFQRRLRQNRAFALALNVLGGLVSLFSAGKISVGRTEYVLVLRK
jgi:2-polyprenyl-3-methyl-5-hydroxy-6-metoxy-1,4-benzoquinol methylase